MNLQELVAKILQRHSEVEAGRSTLIGISGIDGSGKGYITELLAKDLNLAGAKAVSINIDPWLTLPEQRFNSEKPGEHFYYHAFMFNNLFDQLVLPLRQQRSLYLEITLTGELGKPFTQIYDFHDVDIILLEGIFLLQRQLLQHYDFKVWIECSYETALERALQRNQEGLTPEEIIRDYHTIYFPAEEYHLAIDHPAAVADASYINDWRATPEMSYPLISTPAQS